MRIRTQRRIEKIQFVLRHRQPDLAVVLENIHDPHNVSAILRTCDAVGVPVVHLVYHSGQQFPKLGKKSAAGALKWVERRWYASVKECYTALRNEGIQIFASVIAPDSEDLYNLDLTKPIALVYGNEHTGVSQEAKKLADGSFKIPQVGMVQSLNVSVACAVSLYEAFRQRRLAGLYEYSRYSEEELQRLMNEWIQK